MKKFVLAALLGLIVCISAIAQQIPMYGQYIFNSSVINPAQAGAKSENQAGLLGRYQWVGLAGAPTTHTAFVNLRMPHNLGFALGIYQDAVGPVRDLTIQSDISYHTRLSEFWYMSGGLRFVTNSLSINLADMDNIVDSGDPMFYSNLSSGFRFNIGAGILLFDNRSFFGIAMPRAVTVVNKESHEMTPHFFMYGGSTFDLPHELTITPSALFKNSTYAPAQIDLNAIVGYDMFDFGPMVRSNMSKGIFDAVGFLAGVQFTNNWYLGYMYEFPTSSLRTATRQTHEVSLRYQWINTNNPKFRPFGFFVNDRL
jgi:type IX secretion system PorP/SprF family membrane protein